MFSRKLYYPDVNIARENSTRQLCISHSLDVFRKEYLEQQPNRKYMVIYLINGICRVDARYQLLGSLYMHG